MGLLFWLASVSFYFHTYLLIDLSDNQTKLIFTIKSISYSSLASQSPSLSIASRKFYNSSSDILISKYLAALFKFLKDILPVSSSSNNRNAFPFRPFSCSWRHGKLIILEHSGSIFFHAFWGFLHDRLKPNTSWQLKRC